MATVPIIDLNDPHLADAVDHACRNVGFFAVRHHGVPDDLRHDLLAAAAEFFALPTDVKADVAMHRSGASWRGWFALEGELTSGSPDGKEGYYIGDHRPDDSRPMHGPNLWPPHPATLAAYCDEWMACVEPLGQRLLAAMATALVGDADYFFNTLTYAPTSLFRIFRYPPTTTTSARWGVGEHTDYGLLTMLAHDGTPGLQVAVGDEWIDVPHDPSLIVCNIGDMLDRVTNGRYRSTRHRVRNNASHDRISLPFFLDPAWDATIVPLDIDDQWVTPDDAAQRWDRANLRAVEVTYGDWLTAKVSKVFPSLAAALQPAVADMPNR